MLVLSASSGDDCLSRLEAPDPGPSSQKTLSNPVVTFPPAQGNQPQAHPQAPTVSVMASTAIMELSGPARLQSQICSASAASPLHSAGATGPGCLRVFAFAGGCRLDWQAESPGEGKGAKAGGGSCLRLHNRLPRMPQHLPGACPKVTWPPELGLYPIRWLVLVGSHQAELPGMAGVCT